MTRLLFRAALGLLLLAFGASGASADSSARTRVAIALEPASLPSADRERVDDRLSAIAESLDSGVPLFRSFDPREVLADSLAALARLGADVGPTAVVNFDTIEVDLPADARPDVAALPWVEHIGFPTFATPAGVIDSEGLAEVRADLAQAAGITGQGITVAIIDDSFNHLNAVMTDPGDELENIPTTMQYRVNTGASTVTGGVALNGTASQLLEGEHGTACAEVVYEVAPDVTFLLIGFAVQGAGTQYSGGVTAAQIEYAIRQAADLGAKVILVPMYLFHTMSDPNNSFKDDIDYATAAGSTVVVSAGNEELRHVEETFTPCTACTAGDICATASNDTSYHAWDPDFEAIPLNDLIPQSEVDVTEAFQTLTCYSATDAADPSLYEIKLLRFLDDGVCFDFPGCPNDCAAKLIAIAGTTRDLGQGFTVKNMPVYTAAGDDYLYYLSVRRKVTSTTNLCQSNKCIQNGTTECTTNAQCNAVPWPKIRVACTTGVEELYWATETGKSLSDLAVVDNALAVGGLAFFGELDLFASYGPSGDPAGPIKPDLVAPGEVSNFTVFDYGVSDLSDFVGSSAAAAHAAGVVALLQSQALAENGQLLSPAAVKQILQDAALDLGDPGADVRYGAGLVRFPIDPAAGCGNGVLEGDEECDDGNLVSGDCCSATCTAEPAGGSCSDGDACNGDESCDGAGECAAAMPLECSDGDPCTQDSCDPTAGCANAAEPATSCAAFDQGLLLVNEKRPGKEKLTARLPAGPALPPGAFGNPLTPGGTAYTACLYDETGSLAGRLELDRAGSACGTLPCWKSTRRSLRFKDGSGSSDGIRLLQLKGGATRRSQVVLVARNDAKQGQTSLPTGIAAALAGATGATLQIFGSDAPQCLSVTLDEVKKSTASLFKAKAG